MTGDGRDRPSKAVTPADPRTPASPRRLGAQVQDLVKREAEGGWCELERVSAESAAVAVGGAAGGPAAATEAGGRRGRLRTTR